MLRRLAGGDRTVGELAEPFDMSFAAAAKHVKVLEGAGLLSRRIEGRSHHCRIEARPLAEADRWLAHYERFWTLRLDDLERALTLRERAEGVRAAIDGLGAEQRSVVLLREVEGLSYEEIASVLEIPVGTVRSRLYNARATLAERLADWRS